MLAKKRRADRRSRFELDPRLVRISDEEIRADLLYRGGGTRRTARRR
jgi:hypothetical protein